MSEEDLQQQIENHEHTGLDSRKIAPRNLQGFPVFLSAPTHKAPQGTIVLYDDGSANRGIYVMLGGTWYSVAIT